GFHQVHFAHAALILLEGGDALGIGRPQDDGPKASGPTGVVGGVAEVLDAVGGERLLPVGGGVAHPQVGIADEGGVVLVSGEGVGGGGATAAPAPADEGGVLLVWGGAHGGAAPPGAAAPPAPAAPAASGGRRRAFFGGARGALHVALPASTRLDGDRLAVGGELDLLEREVAGGVGAAGGGGERGGKLEVVEGGRAGAFGGIHQDELGALGGGDAIPEALVGQPVGAHAGAEHEGRGVVAHELLGARIVGGGELLLGGGRSDGEQSCGE